MSEEGENLVRDGPFCGRKETLLVLPTGPQGPEGPPGPPGADGAAGPPGESGLPDAFKTFVAGPVAVTQDAFTEVAAMDLPAGIYVATVSLRLVASNPAADPERVTCEIGLNFGGGGNASQGEIALGRGANMVTHATLAMTVARSATADVVRVGCIRSGPGDANASGISVVAIRVGSVTDL